LTALIQPEILALNDRFGFSQLSNRSTTPA